MDRSRPVLLASQHPFHALPYPHTQPFTAYFLTTYDSRADISFVFLDLLRLHGCPAWLKRIGTSSLAYLFLLATSWAFRDSFFLIPCTLGEIVHSG
jgi:hypothetical protein